MSLNFPMFWYQDPITLTGRGAGRAGAAEQVPARTKPPCFCLGDPSPKCSSQACPMRTCFVCALYRLTQGDRTSLKVGGDQSMRRSKHAEKLLHMSFQVARKCWQMNCKRSSLPTLPTLTADARLTLCCFSWDVVPGVKWTWGRWPGSTYPWRCAPR